MVDDNYKKETPKYERDQGRRFGRFTMGIPDARGQSLLLDFAGYSVTGDRMRRALKKELDIKRAKKSGLVKKF